MAEVRSASPYIRRPALHLRGEETLGWGIIGAGYAAASHAIPAIRNQPPISVPGSRYAMTNSWVAGLYSHNERRAVAFGESHKLPHTYINLADLLKRPDIQCIYIGCHPRHHAACTLAALAAGKHVLCEPPLALTTEEASSVVKTAAANRLLLAVNLPLRGDPALLSLRAHLHDGAIGELLGGRITNTIYLRPAQQTWRLQGHGGGVLFDRTTHSIDTLRFLLDDEIVAVDSTSHLRVLEGKAEQDVLSRLTMRHRGFTFTCHDSFVIPHQPTAVEIYGTRGTLTARHCFEHEVTSELYLRHGDEELQIRLPAVDLYQRAIARFTAAIRHGKASQAGGEDGITVLRSVLAAQESIRRRHQVELAPLPRLVTDTSHI